MASIFTPLTQGAQTSERRDGGLGLRLAIARSLLEAHGGTFQAASEGRGRGATLTISMTAAHGAAPTQGAKANEPPSLVCVCVTSAPDDRTRPTTILASSPTPHHCDGGDAREGP